MNTPLIYLLFSFAICIFKFGALAAPNVLFIAIDDLRPALGCYGDQTAFSPNIDKLAARGTVFNRAYCQLAVCAPSRLSLITGLRPDSIKVWDLGTHFREALPDIVTLPQLFKNKGYYTRSIGKILHGGGTASKDPPSWSENAVFDYVREPSLRYSLPKNLVGAQLKHASLEKANVPDNAYTDGVVCDTALEALESLAKKDQPFFLGVGFRKPHLPFVAPSKYWDLYDRDEIPRRASDSHPKGAPDYATRSWLELEGYTDIPQDTAELTPEKIQELRHGYYACISYVDAMIGRLLDRLEELELADDTVICIWGDHGFHLGEQGLWTKANNYELSARVPLILSVPGQPNQGATSNALVELVDLYPTLTELCGLGTPGELEGISLKPLLEAPDRPWKTAAFNQFPRMYKENRHAKHGEVMGYAVRTEHYRYVQWKDWKSGDILEEELYDHQNDPNEMNNVASNPEYTDALTEHLRKLKAGWRGALPRR